MIKNDVSGNRSAGSMEANNEAEAKCEEQPRVSPKNSPKNSPRAQAASARPEHPKHGNQSAQQMEHFHRIRQMVKNAIAARHTFMIHGRARVVRECLLVRGWCEKFQRKPLAAPTAATLSPGNDQQQQREQLSVDSNPATLLAGIGNLSDRQNERLLISKMLTNHTVDFLWNAGSEWSGWPSQDNKTTIFNRYTRANFTSKIGLCSNVRQMHWYYEAGIANTLFPRCYNISQSEQMHAFIDDFRLTACLSLLKWLVAKVNGGGEESVRASNGVIPLKALDFAIGRCSDYLASKSHEDIDQELEKVWSHQWEQFITWYYKLVHGHALFIVNNIPIQKYVAAAQHVLKKINNFWPQLEMDGILNIWILKPGNKSRGRGIVLMNKLDDILAKVNPTNKTTDTRFVIQKYIERPLLIYETKFDIRQWFIVTNAQPLTLWMYRESYLRFCSQKFSLTDLHESVHLSNNAVQCKYKNCPDRDASLPAENMWDIATFKKFLKSKGENEDVWEELIYPGMKQSLVGSLLASQEAMDQRKNSFELYGADFMVMEDFSVWLIEINSHPDMSSSTSVTARLCRKAMEDTIKVVIDHRENPNADTGDFELAYKQKLSSCQAYLGSGLSLQGTRISHPLADKHIGNNNNGGGNYSAAGIAALRKRRASAAAAAAAATSTSTPQLPVHVGPVLVDLIEELELHLDKEFYEYLKLRTAVGTGVTRQIPCLRQSEDQRSPDQTQESVETNTANKALQLLDSNSQMLAKPPASANSSLGKQRNSVGKQSKNPSKNSSSKRSAKYKMNIEANNESSVTPQAAKKLVSKIVNLKKESNKIKSATVNRTSKLYPLSKASKNMVLKNDIAEVDENLAIKYRQIVPSISESLTTSIVDKNAKTSTLLLEENGNQARRQSTKKSNHVFVNVPDMYAVGLAVKK